ncbi:pyruvate kinase, partial [Acinetobacter baumannii]
KIKELIDAGMNVARINCSHGDWETRGSWIGWIRELNDPVAPVAILVDLQGPKVRLGEIEGGSVEVTEGQNILVGHPQPGLPPDVTFLPVP